MEKKSVSQSAFFNPRVFLAFLLCFVGALLAMFSFAAPPPEAGQPQIRRGKPVVPSEFRGDVRDLPQSISPEERMLFIRPLELDIPLPGTKQVLPGALPEAPTQVPVPLAPMPTPATTF